MKTSKQIKQEIRRAKEDLQMLQEGYGADEISSSQYFIEEVSNLKNIIKQKSQALADKENPAKQVYYPFRALLANMK